MNNIQTTEFSDLIGKTLVSAENIGNESLVLLTDDGYKFTFHHFQNCCESVYIDDVVGDLNDLVGSPILIAEKNCSDADQYIYGQWTFYKFATNKGYVDVKWLGHSNGYYSIDVNLSIERVS